MMVGNGISRKTKIVQTDVQGMSCVDAENKKLPKVRNEAKSKLAISHQDKNLNLISGAA